MYSIYLWSFWLKAILFDWNTLIEILFIGGYNRRTFIKQSWWYFDFFLFVYISIIVQVKREFIHIQMKTCGRKLNNRFIETCIHIVLLLTFCSLKFVEILHFLMIWWLILMSLFVFKRVLYTQNVWNKLINNMWLLHMFENKFWISIFQRTPEKFTETCFIGIAPKVFINKFPALHHRNHLSTTLSLEIYDMHEALKRSYKDRSGHPYELNWYHQHTCLRHWDNVINGG